MRNHSKLFKCEAVLKFREDRYIYIDKTVAVNGITFESISKTKVKISFNIEAENLDNASIYGKRVIEKILAIICLKTNVGATIDNFKVFEIPSSKLIVEEKNGLISARIITSVTIRLKDRFSIRLDLSEESLKNVMNALNILDTMDPNKQDYILRFLYWYNKALLEQDDINKFMLLWTALEVWKTYKFGSSRGGRHREKMKAILQEYGYEGSIDEIYDLRNDIFHEGVREDVRSLLPLLEQCIYRILDELREYLVNIGQES